MYGKLKNMRVCLPDCLIKNNFDSNLALKREVEILNAENYRAGCLLITGVLVQESLEGEHP